MEALGEAGDVADDGGGAVTGLGEGDGALDAGRCRPGRRWPSSRQRRRRGRRSGRRRHGWTRGVRGRRWRTESGGADESVGRGAGSVCSSIDPRGNREPRVASPACRPIVRRNAETRARAIIARRSARIGSARMWMSIDSLDRSARSRRSPTPNAASRDEQKKRPRWGWLVWNDRVRHAPAAGALGAVHVLDAGEGHGEGSGGHGFGV